MKKEALELLEYHHWSNITLLNRLKELPEDVYTKELSGTFSSISETFSHIFQIDQQWFRRMNPDALTIAIECKKIEETEQHFKDLNKRMFDFVGSDYEQLKEVRYENTKGDSFHNSIDELIRHIANHGTYHRGNISTMIRQLGFESVSTDYIFFLRTKN